MINKRAKFNVLLSEKAPDVPSGGRLPHEHLRFYVPLDPSGLFVFILDIQSSEAYF